MFVLFLFAIVLSVLVPLMTFDYNFGIFNLFFLIAKYASIFAIPGHVFIFILSIPGHVFIFIFIYSRSRV